MAADTGAGLRPGAGPPGGSGLRAGVGVSTAPAVRVAAEEACAAALAAAGLERAEAGLVFATPDHAELATEVLAACAGRLGTDRLAGCCVQGLLAPGLHSEGGPALGVAALAGVEARPFLLGDLRGHEGRAGEELAALVGSPPRTGDLVLLFPDPDALAGPALVAGLRDALGPAAAAGAGAVEAAGGAPLQWAGGAAATGGVAGMLLRGAAPRLGVTQSCLPATEAMVVTRAAGHWVLELDGRPALDVYREVARAPLAEDLRRAAAFVMVALPRGRGAELAPGGYVVRNAAGFDPERGAFAVADRVGPGDRLALAVREPEAARADLKRMLGALAEPRPRLALYFDCVARGAALFGIEGLEAGYLESALAPAPHLGVLGAFELGPVGGQLELLTYTGVMAALG